MNPEAAAIPDSKFLSHRRSAILRGLVVFNIVLVAVSWSRWFSGDARHIGMVDQIIGHLRLGGFRVDVLWLVFTTIFLGIAFLYFASHSLRSREARINAIFCLCGIVGFCLYVYRALTTGVLDFG
jgi:ABC-type transport system involved in cytochrome c biogenesis permease subunit